LFWSLVSSNGKPSFQNKVLERLRDFRGPDVGTFVFHCHILNHEDMGMMNIIQVVPASSAKNSPAGAAPAHANRPEGTPPMTMNHASESRKNDGSMIMTGGGGKM
jgi:hypothetical protein